MAAVARRQHGNATYGQLRAAGLTDEAIEVRARRGRLFRLHHGVYAVGRPPNLPLERAAAAVLACGSGAALSHWGALCLWGFSTDWPRGFEVVAESDRRPAGITVHRYRGLIRRDLAVQRGIRVTSPARTVLDVARRLDDRTRARTLNDALHSPFLTRAGLADVRRRFPYHAGAKLLDPYLEHIQSGLTRSPFEDDFVAFCARHGLPRPQTNVRVAGHLVDALFADHALIVELDSWEFHSDRHAFETDRERDADTLAAGCATVRITWERLQERPAAEAARLQAILSVRRLA